MSIISVCGIAFLCICAVIVVRDNGSKTFAIIISSVCSLAIILYSVKGISGSINQLWSFLKSTSDLKYTEVVVKSFGIAFVCDVCSDSIRDLGGESLASSLEFTAKAEILLLCSAPLTEVLAGALRLVGQAV